MLCLKAPKTDRPNCENDRRVGLRLPATLHASLENVAVRRGVPMSLLVRTALEREVSLHEARVAAARDLLRLRKPAGSVCEAAE
jgi:predicted DNA-binding protein